MAKKKSSPEANAPRPTPRKIVPNPEAVEALGLPVDPAEQHAEIVRRLSVARPRGRPPIEAPKKGQTIYLDPEIKSWLRQNLPRRVSESAFCNLALKRLIEAIKADPDLGSELLKK